MAKFIRRKLIMEFVTDGLRTSDLETAGVVLSIVEGTDCPIAIPLEGDPSRLVFFIQGDPAKIKECIDNWYSMKWNGDREKLLRSYISKIEYLKKVLDTAKMRRNG